MQSTQAEMVARCGKVGCVVIVKPRSLRGEKERSRFLKCIEFNPGQESRSDCYGIGEQPFVKEVAPQHFRQGRADEFRARGVRENRCGVSGQTPERIK